MSEQSDLIKHFQDICGTGEEQARFFLEASGWDLDAAASEFFSSVDNTSNSGAKTASEPVPPPVPDELEDSRSRPTGSSGGNQRFVSMAAFRSKDQSDSEEEEGQAFYVGGSEKGAGQQVLGPPRKKTGDIVKQMFESAREHGATVPTEPEPATSSSRGMAFTGVGYRLGDNETAPSEMVAGAQRRPLPVDRVLKLWRDGFSIDDGPLRNYHDEENREFLSAVQRGEIPDELLKSAKGGEVNLNMEDHRHDTFKSPPTQKVVPFSGKGHTLGSPAPPVTTNPEPTKEPAATVPSVSVDSSQPTTRLQIRLDDGSRLVINLNHSHTVGDIRQEIMSQRPRYGDGNFVLMTTFPNKELSDESETISGAKLLNAAIALRLKH